MLTIKFGHFEGEKLSGNGYFDVNVDESIIETDKAKEIIKAIDKGIVLGKNNIDTEVLGAIPPRLLSGGTKVLLTLLSDHYNKVLFAISAMGDNCLPFLADIAKEKDIIISADQFRPMFELTDIDKIHIDNYNITVTSDKDFWDQYARYRLEVDNK